MGMILRIASSRIVGQGDIVGRSGYFSLNLSANSVMRGRLDARRTLKSLVADLRLYTFYLSFTGSRCRARNNSVTGGHRNSFMSFSCFSNFKDNRLRYISFKMVCCCI